MNKQFEAGILVAVAVLATMSATTLYHASDKVSANPVDRYVAREWEALSHWVKNNVAKSGSNEKSATDHAETKVQDTPVSMPAATNTNATLPSDSEDSYKKLAEIGKEFVSSMKPTDWQTLWNALSNDNADQADKVIVSMIQTHIPNDDRVWLVGHFQGSQNFDAEDVSLLQSSIQQAESELTPKEMALLQQAIPSVTSVSH